MGFILKIIGGRLNGYKTYGAGAGMILLGLLHFINLLWPGTVSQVPPADFNAASTEVTAGLALIGIGHKMDKSTAVEAACNSDVKKN